MPSSTRILVWAAEPFTTYTLIVGVGNRNASFSPAGAMAILGLTVLDGDAALSEPDANAQIAADDTLAATAVYGRYSDR